MGRTGPVHTDIGEWLAECREKKGWGFRQAVRIAEGRKLRMITLGSLGGLEAGTTQHPEQLLLRQVATLYGGDVTYETLARRFFANNYGRDLPLHTLEIEQASTLRGAFEAAQARVVELEETIEEREARLRDVQNVASRLVQIAAGPKDPASGAGTPQRSGRHRKARG